MKPRRGTFEQWMDHSKKVNAPCTIHGFFQSADEHLAEPVAVIELEDGSVTTLSVWSVKFTEPAQEPKP